MVRRAAVVLGLVLAGACMAQDPVVLEGSLNAGDAGHYKSVPFEVPAGVKRINVTWTATGREQGAFVTLGVLDPVMFRGLGRASFTIAETDATPPLVAGPLPAGTWNLMLGAANIPDGVTVRYEARIRLETRLDPANRPVIRQGPAWYTGDLHSHTGHSDGVCKSQTGKTVPCPAHRLVEAAAARGLDFLAVTDHDTGSTFHAVDEMQPYFDRMLLMHGREMTTLRGHANVWGTVEPVNARIGWKGWTLDQFFDQVHGTGALVSINHPHWPNNASCPGCGWQWGQDTNFSKVDAIEAVNGYNDKGRYFVPPPGDGVAFWEEKLAKGFRITAVGGSDDHYSGDQLAEDNGVGRPATVVYAAELSEKAILDAIRAGRVYVRTQGPDGPELEFNAGTTMMGGDLKAAKGEEKEFTVKVRRGRGLDAAALLDGKAVDGWSWKVDSDNWAGSFRSLFDGGRHWIRVEVRDAGGRRIAIGNPVYVNFRQ